MVSPHFHTEKLPRPCDPLVIDLFRNLGCLIVRWYPVGSAYVDRLLVDLEEEGFARCRFEGALNEFDRANAKGRRYFMQ